jgi:ribose transport system substrate-binding protein
MHKALWRRIPRIGAVLVALTCQATIALAADETTVVRTLSANTSATVASTSGTTVAMSLHFQFIAARPTGFWKLVRSGAERAARNAGATVDFLVMIQGSEEEQKRLVDLAVAKNMAGLAIAPAPGATATQEIDRAAEKMPVLTLGVDVPTSRRRCFIGSDQYHAGLEAGRALAGAVSATTGSRSIGIVAGQADDAIVRERLRGVKDALAGRFTLVGPLYDSGLEDKAGSNVEAILEGTPDLVGMVGISRHNGPVIARVMRDLKAEGRFKVVCFDEELETVAAISDGRIYASVVEDPFEIGSRAVTLLAALAKGDTAAIPEKGMILTGVRVLRASGIGEFVRQLTTQSKRTE